MHEEFYKSQIPTNKRWRDLERQNTQQTRPPTWHFDEYQSNTYEPMPNPVHMDTT